MPYDRPAPQKVLKVNIVILYRLYYPVDMVGIVDYFSTPDPSVCNSSTKANGTRGLRIISNIVV